MRDCTLCGLNSNIHETSTINMGRKKSKSNLLPPSERTVVGSKIVTSSGPWSADSNVPIRVRIHEVVGASSQTAVPANTSTATVSPISVQLDDDALRKVLRHAGPLAILSASRVCRNWRRVALIELGETTRLDLASALRRNRTNTMLSYHAILNIIESFPALTQLSLRKFVHSEVLPELGPYLMTKLRSPMITSVDFSGFDFTPSDLVSLLTGCPALQHLTIAQCPAIWTPFITALIGALASNARLGPGAAAASLNVVDVSGCARMDDEAIVHLVSSGVVDEIRACRCINIRRIDHNHDWRTTATTLNLHHCRNLIHVRMCSGSLMELNLSQCASLTRLILRPVEPDLPHSLRVLNLASCAMLRDILFGLPQVEDGGALPSIPLPLLEELLLSRLRSLPSDIFSRVFGLDRIICPLPNLRRLELIGTQIEELRLKGYKQLAIVDVSGCSHLNIINVAECWNIERFNLSSKQAPLAHVSMILPVKAVVSGIRSNWAWQTTESMQMIDSAVYH